MSGGEIPREQFGFGNWKNRHVLVIGGIRSCEVGVESDSNQHCGESVDDVLLGGGECGPCPGVHGLCRHAGSVGGLSAR